MGRIGRSFSLVGQSYRVLMQDKELMVLPLISGLICGGIVLAAVFGFGLVSPGKIDRHAPATYIPLFLFLVVSNAVGIFFQAAVVAGATERLRGGDPTIGSALAAAGRRAGSILLWAVIAATVGFILRAIQERVGFVGKIVAGLVGAAWSLATFFIVPVLVLEDKSIKESFTRSVSIFTKTWGESFVGGASLGIAGLVGWVTLVAIVGLLASLASATLAFAVGAVGAVGLIVFFSALQGVFVASLYQYATNGAAANGFDRDLLRQAFVEKRR